MRKNNRQNKVLKFKPIETKKTISLHKLGLCNLCFPKVSFYKQKITHTIFQGREMLQKSMLGAPLLVQESFMF